MANGNSRVPPRTGGPGQKRVLVNGCCPASQLDLGGQSPVIDVRHLHIDQYRAEARVGQLCACLGRCPLSAVRL